MLVREAGEAALATLSFPRISYDIFSIAGIHILFRERFRTFVFLAWLYHEWCTKKKE